MNKFIGFLVLSLVATTSAQHIESNEEYLERANQARENSNGNFDEGILCHWFSEDICPPPWLACGCHGSGYNWAPNKQKCIRCCHNDQDPNCIACPTFESCEFLYTEEVCRCGRVTAAEVELRRKEEQRRWREAKRRIWKAE